MPSKVPGEKCRYIAFKIESGSSFPRNDFLSALLRESRGTALGDSFRITVSGTGSVFDPIVTGTLVVPALPSLTWMRTSVPHP